MCSVGEVMNVAVPSGFKLTSQSRIQLNPEFNLEETQVTFTEEELNLFNSLKKSGSLAYHEAAEVLKVSDPYKIIKYLIAKKVILIFEELKEKYKPKIVKKIKLNSVWTTSEAKLNEVFEQVGNSTKQEEVLLKYLSIAGSTTALLNESIGVEKPFFIKEGKNISVSSLNTLIKKQILEEFETIVPRFNEYERGKEEDIVIQLSELQNEAKSKILKSFESKHATLLFGVTGSGKTEVYITLIQQVLESGAQALLLLPEIVLTTQMVNRLKNIFGNQMGVYHSRFSDNERVEVWQAVLSGKFNFIVGVRSSVFLPFNNLGLIVVDEEHEPSYKQYDPAPRYHARDAAQVLARLHHAKVLLGSATPSVESFYLGLKGQYGLVELNERFGGASLPLVTLVDLRKEKKQRKMQGEFSSTLIDKIEEKLGLKKQAILFQNRRGYAPYIMCEDCGHIPSCNNCAVSLTYHMYTNIMICHYCGYKDKITGKCTNCSSLKLKTFGIGTEKIEDELQVFFPKASIERMDLDTTRKKYSYERILDAFSTGQTDILVGTQMVSKGLDFENVELVGVFDIDRLMYFPNFRSHERAFQLISQVSGRSGRRGKNGEVIIQTSSPDHPLLKDVVHNRYRAFYDREIQERKKYLYPPYSRLIRLTVKNISKNEVDAQSNALGEILSIKLGKKRIIGPESPVIDKIRNFYLKDILIKLERSKVDLEKAKKLISEAITKAGDKKRFKKINVVVDVDCI
jgi:primosomal protein N' (replication factor Y)